MNHCRDFWALCDDILCDVQQLPRRSIHVTDGCLWTLTRIGRNLGNSSSNYEYRIHRLRNNRREIWTRKKSSKNTPPRQCHYVDYLHTFPCYIFYLARWNRFLRIHDARPYRRIRRTNYYAKSSTTRASGTSLWIRTIYGKYCFSTYSFFHMTTHAIPRDSMTRKSSWK